MLLGSAGWLLRLPQRHRLQLGGAARLVGWWLLALCCMSKGSGRHEAVDLSWLRCQGGWQQMDGLGRVSEQGICWL